MGQAPKDYFSTQASAYASFRPTYPQALYDFILDKTRERSVAWDCATGNGQVARVLSKHFKRVEATDISKAQLEKAVRADNIHYSVAPAESSSLGAATFELITVAQALHWFDLDRFYKEVRRVARPGAILAVWCYKLLSISKDLDNIIHDFYLNVTGPYWDPARQIVDEEYRTIPFPFKEISSPVFYQKEEWSPHHLAGFLTSWSATQNYIRENGHDPVTAMMTRVSAYWEEGARSVRFPIYARIGTV